MRRPFAPETARRLLAQRWARFLLFFALGITLGGAAGILGSLVCTYVYRREDLCLTPLVVFLLYGVFQALYLGWPTIMAPSRAPEPTEE